MNHAWPPTASITWARRLERIAEVAELFVLASMTGDTDTARRTGAQLVTLLELAGTHPDEAGDLLARKLAVTPPGELHALPERRRRGDRPLRPDSYPFLSHRTIREVAADEASDHPEGAA